HPCPLASNPFPYTTLFRSHVTRHLTIYLGNPCDSNPPRSRPRARRAPPLDPPERAQGHDRQHHRGCREEERRRGAAVPSPLAVIDRKSTRLNSSHGSISYA